MKISNGNGVIFVEGIKMHKDNTPRQKPATFEVGMYFKVKCHVDINDSRTGINACDPYKGYDLYEVVGIWTPDETIIGQYKDDTNANVFILRILDHTNTRDELNPYLDVYLSEDDLNKIRQIINVNLEGGAKE